MFQCLQELVPLCGRRYKNNKAVKVTKVDIFEQVFLSRLSKCFYAFTFYASFALCRVYISRLIYKLHLAPFSTFVYFLFCSFVKLVLYICIYFFILFTERAHKLIYFFL